MRAYPFDSSGYLVTKRRSLAQIWGKRQLPASRKRRRGSKPAVSKLAANPYHNSISCTQEQRVEIGRLLNLTNSKEDIDYWGIAHYLLFGTWRDEHSNRLVVSAKIIATILNKRTQDVNVVKVMEAFAARTDAAITLTDYKPKRKARELDFIEWPEGVSELAAAIRRPKKRLDERILFITGLRCTKQVRRDNLKAARDMALAVRDQVHNEFAGFLTDLLNTLSPNIWTSAIDRNIEDLREIVAAGKNPEQTLNILLAIEVQPVPVYIPVENTSRIYTTGAAVVYLPSAYQKWLYARMGLTLFDLKHCQLAIIALIWDTPKLDAYLRSGKDFWPEILGHVNLDPTDPANKSHLKASLYSLMFGMEVWNLEATFVRFVVERAQIDDELAANPMVAEMLRERTGDRSKWYQKWRECRELRGAFKVWRKQGAELFNLWRRHEAIAEVFDARERQMRKYLAEGGACDAYGKWRACMSKEEVKSVLASVAQSFELRLLEPAIRRVESERDCKIAFWLHDGLGVAIPRGMERVVDGITHGVGVRIAEVGVPTKVEVSGGRHRG